jgi:hypothetical protein
MTVVSCFVDKEENVQIIAEELKAAGLYSRYGETAYGERILISVHTNDFHERDILRSILGSVGITELTYTDNSAS